MKTFSTFFKPTSIFLTIVLLLMSTFYQSASAAMIRTETLLEPDRRLQTRDDLQQLLARKDVQEALIAWGINPLEAKARINSFSDTEI
ncbi:MAG: PA2779 family protein, partial [Desulfobacterales bacterium]